MSRFKQPQGMAGERALLVGVIKQATVDLSSSSTAIRQDAEDYFAGDEYQQHLQILGMGAGIFPTELNDMHETKKRIARWRQGDFTPSEAADILDREVSRVAEKSGLGYCDAFAAVAEARPNLVSNYQSIRRRHLVEPSKMHNIAKRRRQEAERYAERQALDERIKDHAEATGLTYNEAYREVMADE